MTCVWEQDEDSGDYYSTSCGRVFCITEGTPSENSFKFCAFCGNPIEEVPYKPEPDEEAMGA